MRPPPALPPSIVESIAREIFTGDDIETFLVLTKSADLRIPNHWFEAFVEAAIDWPHYANGSEIRAATRESERRVAIMVAKVKTRIRNNRSHRKS